MDGDNTLEVFKRYGESDLKTTRLIDKAAVTIQSQVAHTLDEKRRELEDVWLMTC